jgi:hypothetical protein
MSLTNPAYKEHVPYYIVISGLSGFIFFHKRYGFRKKLLNKKFCFDFLYDFCLKYFSSQK